MNNRFSSCKSLKDLYVVFENEEDVLEYSNLSDEELDRVAIVFEANLPNKVDMPDVPLTNAGYNFVWNVVVDTINKQSKKEEEEIMNKPNEKVTMKGLLDETIKEAVSKKDKAKATVINAANGIEEAAKAAKVELNKDVETLVGECDASLNVIKDEMDPVLTALDEIMGGTALKEEICGIMYSNLNTKDENGFFTMARKCREAIERKIKVLEAVDPNDKLGRIAALKVYVEAVDKDGNTVYVLDENGNKTVESVQTIWMAFAKAVVWVCKKASAVIKIKLGTNASTNIFGAVGASIAQVFASIGNVIANAAKIAGTGVTFIASYAVAGVIKAVNFVISACKWVAGKISGWYEAAKDKITNKDKKDIEEEMEDIMEQAYFGNDADEEDEVTE